MMNISTTEARLLIPRLEAAAQLSISVRKLDYLITAKQIAVRRIGKKVLILRAELERFARGK